MVALWFMVGGACFLGWLLLLAYAKFTGSKIALELRRSYVAAIAGIAIIFSVLLVAHTALGFMPSRVFSQAFGFGPTSDVSALRGYRLDIFDSGEIFLRFHASQQTVDRIVGSKYKVIDKAAFGDGTSGEGVTPPSYWKPFDLHPTQFYESESIEVGYASGRALLCYDDKSGVAYFSYSGVD